MDEELQPAPSPSFINRIFLGPDGLRAGWSVLLFISIFAICLVLFGFILSTILHALHVHLNQTVFSPLAAALNELLLLLCWLVPAWVMSAIEHKPIFSYGYQGTHRISRLFFGILWGFISISALVLALWKLGYLGFDPGIFTGIHSLEYAAAWAAVFLAVGFAEESLLRGYLQSTLTRGLGFWWAALILSVAFGSIHLSNSGESPIGLISAGAIGLLFCLSLWYTGSLWWAIGFHAAWDWGENYFYGTANSGILVQGHLLSEHPIGNIYLSGGKTGPEGSLYVLVLILALALGMVLYWHNRTNNRAL